ncbi:MAG: hypothetical protein K0R26_1032 [Bacteroidota bacterium]|jgi:integrase|nr:hypothetical protein [Bacteroidota bacterium]
MITIHLVLDRRRCKRDKTYPLVFRLASNGTTRTVSTNFSSSPSDWNDRAGCLKETHPLFEVISPRLKELEVFYLTKILEYQKLYPKDNDTQRIKNYLCSVSQSPTTIQSFWLDEIELLHKNDRGGGALVYELSLIAISKISDLRIPFERVNYTFLRTLEAGFSDAGLKTNSIGMHMRSFRAVFNKAIKSKITTHEHYPFKDFKIKRKATSPRPIPREEMSSYFRLNIPEGSILYDSWLMGKLMFMLQGINFKDMVLLTESSVMNGPVFYSRSKTKTLYSIKMLQDVIEIFAYFRQRGCSTILGKLTQEELDNKRKLPKTIKQKNKNFNAHLKKMGMMIGCKERFTSYVFRYSYANIAKRLGYSKDMIAEALGHKYGSAVTGLYLEAYDKELIDDMNHYVHLTVTMPEITPTS